MRLRDDDEPVIRRNAVTVVLLLSILYSHRAPATRMFFVEMRAGAVVGLRHSSSFPWRGETVSAEVARILLTAVVVDGEPLVVKHRRVRCVDDGE